MPVYEKGIKSIPILKCMNNLIIYFNNGETLKGYLLKIDERLIAGQKHRLPQEMVLFQPILTSQMYLLSHLVNHFNFLNRTLLGKIWAPLANWFNML